MAALVRVTIVLALGAIFTSCATQPARSIAKTARGHVQTIRTTAYTNAEGSGGRNALGQRLSGGGIMSASSDWSRFPVGTRFKVLSTGEEFVIDDYGGALVGTNTIDLYKNSRGEMRRWGVRHVDIEILHWGSDEESLKVLRPRHKVGRVRRMIASLERKHA
ncbi:MAG: 3D domain-containing protein [Verrucomicrobiota bacterium]|nr:3D domain-containing protein [Verrucomicrobiota bacterium]